MPGCWRSGALIHPCYDGGQARILGKTNKIISTINLQQAGSASVMTMIKKLLPALLLSAFCFQSQAGTASAPHLNVAQLQRLAPAQQLAQLAEQYYQHGLYFDPIGATYNGDDRYNDRLPETLNPRIRAKKAQGLKQIAGQLNKLKREQFSPADQVSYDCLKYEIEAELALEKFDEHLLPFTQMDSLPLTLAHFASGQSAQPLQTIPQYWAFLHRLQQLPNWLKQAQQNMQSGMKQGLVLPKALVSSSLPQFAQLISTDLDSHPYYAAVKNMPGHFSASEKQALSRAYSQILQKQVIPALTRFHTFVSRDYLNAARTSTGWSDLPNGKDWYAALVRYQTTTTLSYEEIHQTGLREVARIQAEFARLGPQLGYHGEAQALPAWMDKQDKYRPFKTEQEILAAYKEIDLQVKSHLPNLFGKIPKAALEVRPEPEISRATASDHYTNPSLDGTRPGVFWVVINKPEEYANTGMKTLYLHEGQPGHHFHLAGLQELDVPKFRKTGGNNAYTEGWALYAETLGHEMGLYANDPNAYFGHLSDEMLRATRLVVDTGMHAKGWSREQGIQYIKDTLGYNEAMSKQVIERYMAWPAQALGYKVGSLKIMELRKLAEKELGQAFKLKDFHDMVLSDGTLPLKLLEQKALQWIASQQAQKN